LSYAQTETMDALPQARDPSIKNGSNEFGSGFSSNLVDGDVPDVEIAFVSDHPWQSFSLMLVDLDLKMTETPRFVTIL
jgi:hypothetical protein